MARYYRFTRVSDEGKHVCRITPEDNDTLEDVFSALKKAAPNSWWEYQMHGGTYVDRQKFWEMSTAPKSERNA